MNISTMRTIDQYVGTPICIFLGFLKAILNMFSKNKPTAIKAPKKILAIKFWGMGTILFISPTLRAIKKKFPYAKIYILTLPQNRAMCEMLPCIDEIICFNMKNPAVFIYNFFKTIGILWMKRFDTLIDFEFFTNFASIVTFFSGVNNTIGFASPKAFRKIFYKVNVSFCHDRHIIAIFLKIAQALKVDNPDDSLEEERVSLIKHEDKNFIAEFSKKQSIKERDFLIAMNINASSMCLNRRWPKDNFRNLTSELIKNERIKIALIGSKEDKEYVSDFKQRFSDKPQVVDLCAEINLKQLISLLARANLFIGNDSGPLHIAAILGVSTISFFGPETPFLYGPPQLDKHSVFYRDIYCSPCLNVYNSKTSHCRDNQCLKGISFEEVFKLVEQKYIHTLLR